MKEQNYEIGISLNFEDNMKKINSIHYDSIYTFINENYSIKNLNESITEIINYLEICCLSIEEKKTILNQYFSELETEIHLKNHYS